MRTESVIQIVIQNHCMIPTLQNKAAHKQQICNAFGILNTDSFVIPV